MIVPQYWAESRVQHRRPRRQVTVRRFGWSDAGLADAQAMADARAAEALRRILAGENIPRREPRIGYNGADGVPIREEIVARHGETIITRNSYGARCLNTPNIFFADIDFHHDGPSSCGLYSAVLGLLLAGLAYSGWVADSMYLGLAAVLFAFLVSNPISYTLHRLLRKVRGSAEAEARGRIGQFLERNPEWNLHLYRTPAGLRLLATHRAFDPTEAAVRECFDALGTDPIYVAMCRKQRCFRARLSAKPWRIGIRHHMKPRPGVWPVHPDRQPERDAWIDAYEAAAGAFAACAFIEEVGSGIVHPDVWPVVELHDEMCRAKDGLPLA